MIEDWEIAKYNFRELLHKCKKERNLRKISTMTASGKWVCLDCGAIAPEEIADAALLAGCRVVDTRCSYDE
jgi:hypothetical protein